MASILLTLCSNVLHAWDLIETLHVYINETQENKQTKVIQIHFLTPSLILTFERIENSWSTTTERNLYVTRHIHQFN